MCIRDRVWAEIKRLHRVENRRVSDIARHLHVDRKTVRKTLAQERLPVPTRVRRTPTLLAAHRGFIQERLKAYPHLPATVIHQELQTQGYAGSVRIVQDHLKALRQKTKEVFLRIETAPGEEGQCDWAHCGTCLLYTSRCV